MNVYTTDRIRNVVLLGHGGCGKTSLVEAMAYLAGMTSRMGKVEDGNTISDYDKEEMKRHFSINTSVVPIIWEDTKINILDTPGYFDFVGETEEAVSAADAAIIVVSGKAGIEVGTRKAWELCEQYKLPRMVFVTDMDIDEASYRQVVQDLQELYGKKIAPFHLPIRENGQFVGYVNVLQQRAKRWKENGEVEKTDVPDYSKENLGICREALMEAVAETSEEFMDRYFGGEEFSEDEIRQALRVNVAEGSIVPVLMGSNILARGIYTRHKMIAYDVNPETHELVERWRWLNNEPGSPWFGEGYHNFGIADVDWDGRDEIVYGSMGVDDNGKDFPQQVTATATHSIAATSTPTAKDRRSLLAMRTRLVPTTAMRLAAESIIGTNTRKTAAVAWPESLPKSSWAARWQPEGPAPSVR